MKKLLSVVVTLFSLVAILVFTASAESEITGIAVGKHVYGTAVLKWFVEDISDDYYFNIYLDDEKISPKQGYNGRHFYCYVDEIYPGDTHKYKVEYYGRNILGGYKLIDEFEKNVAVEDYFNGYGYSLSGVSKSSDSVNLEWDYRTGDLDLIIDPETDDRLLNVSDYFFEIYFYKNGIWSKAGETKKQKFTVEGLEEDTEYQFRVKAYCKGKEQAGNCFLDESEIIKVKTIIEYMDGFTVAETTETTALLKWDIDSEALLESGIYTDDYYFDIYMEEDYNTTKKIGTTSESEYMITGLQEYTDYTVFVVLNCTGISGDNEKVETSKHIDFETTFTYFKETAVSSVKSTSAEISWKFDEEGHNGDLKGDNESEEYYYYVYYINDEGRAVRIGTTEKQSYSLKNLNPNTGYTIRVVAYYKDAFTGKKVRIEAIDFEDFTTRVAAPERIIISYTPNKKLATIKWSAVEGASGYILYEYDFDEKEYVRLEKQKGRTYTFSYTYGEKYRFYVKAYKTTDGKDSAGEGTKNTFIPCKKVTVSSDNQSVKPGKKLALKATLSPSDSTDKIKWTTSNSEIATVSSKGVVKGVKNGKVTITATASSGKKATFKITVTNASISKTSKTVNVGQSYTIKINDYSGKVSWSTSNKKVATVSSKGVVKGVASGSAVITAKLKNGAVFTCKIKVTRP